ncbi:MAG: hypothetical protein AB7N91_03260 [Candidatus Tectimicrobiota bacterium]
MSTSMPLKTLLEQLLTMDGAFVLCNAHGSLEFRGQDFYLSSYQDWLTIYHSTPKNPESQSHLHLKWRTLRTAVVIQEPEKTPYLAFYGTPEATADEPLLIWYFPSFYDWSNGKTAIPANMARHAAFVETYGTMLHLVDPPASS